MESEATILARLIAVLAAVVLLVGGRLRTASAADLRVLSDFEGGSAAVESIDQAGRVIRLEPARHEGRGWVCWWYLKVLGIEPGETITLDVGSGPWATPDRAAFSTDNVSWRHTANGTRQGKRIVYRQQVGAREAWFAWGPPFRPCDAATFVERMAAASPHATALELCRTRADRATPAVCVAQAGTGPAQHYGVWIQARQHAWESGSSWVCRGLAEWLVSDDPRAEALRGKARVTLVPIMDVDNTFLGAGGKEQKPRDHNRDWCEKPHWRSVAAAMDRIQEQDSAGRFDLFVDLHNPGADSQQPFFYFSPADLLADAARRNQQRFLEAVRAEMTAPLPLAQEQKISGAGYHELWKQISKNWVNAHTAGHVVAVTLETPWNTPHSTTDGYRQVGRQLGRAIERYLRVNPRTSHDDAEVPAE